MDLAAPVDNGEDWSQIKSPRARKRAQNRLSQRKHRAKVRGQSSGMDSSSCDQADVSPFNEDYIPTSPGGVDPWQTIDWEYLADTEELLIPTPIAPHTAVTELRNNLVEAVRLSSDRPGFGLQKSPELPPRTSEQPRREWESYETQSPQRVLPATWLQNRSLLNQPFELSTSASGVIQPVYNDKSLLPYVAAPVLSPVTREPVIRSHNLRHPQDQSLRTPFGSQDLGVGIQQQNLPAREVQGRQAYNASQPHSLISPTTTVDHPRCDHCGCPTLQQVRKLGFNSQAQASPETATTTMEFGDDEAVANALAKLPREAYNNIVYISDQRTGLEDEQRKSQVPQIQYVYQQPQSSQQIAPVHYHTQQQQQQASSQHRSAYPHTEQAVSRESQMNQCGAHGCCSRFPVDPQKQERVVVVYVLNKESGTDKKI